LCQGTGGKNKSHVHRVEKKTSKPEILLPENERGAKKGKTRGMEPAHRRRNQEMCMDTPPNLDLRVRGLSGGKKAAWEQPWNQGRLHTRRNKKNYSSRYTGMT